MAQALNGMNGSNRQQKKYLFWGVFDSHLLICIKHQGHISNVTFFYLKFIRNISGQICGTFAISIACATSQMVYIKLSKQKREKWMNLLIFCFVARHNLNEPFKGEEKKANVEKTRAGYEAQRGQ